MSGHYEICPGSNLPGGVFDLGPTIGLGVTCQVCARDYECDNDDSPEIVHLHKRYVPADTGGPGERSFDWEKRYEHDAWRTTSEEMAHRFSVGLTEGGLSPQFLDLANPIGPLFWWDRKLTPDERSIARRALTLAMEGSPDDGD